MIFFAVFTNEKWHPSYLRVLRAPIQTAHTTHRSGPLGLSINQDRNYLKGLEKTHAHSHGQPRGGGTRTTGHGSYTTILDPASGSAMYILKNLDGPHQGFPFDRRPMWLA